MDKIAKDVAKGELPLTIAFAEVVPMEDLGSGTPYATYTTDSGRATQVLDDSQIKDED